MKFFALVAAASAVRLSSKNKSTDGPSAAQFIDYCDKDGNDMLSFNEVVDCIEKHAPHNVTRKQIADYMRPLFNEADTSGDGQVDLNELRAAFAAHNSLAQTKASHPTPAEIIDACDTNGSGGISRKEAHACIDAHISDPEERKMAHGMVKRHWNDVDTDGSGEVDEHELSRAMQAHEGLAKLSSKGGPSPSDIIDACDTNESGGISKEEAHACIDAHISDPDMNAHAHQAVDEGFDYVDADGSGEVDEHELAAAMRAHRGNGLAKAGPPSRQEIQQLVDHCDRANQNGEFDGELTVNEIARCFGVPESEVEPIFNMVDTSGNGKISVDEIHTFLRNHM